MRAARKIDKVRLYQAYDGVDASAPVTVSLTVIPRPVAENDQFRIRAGTSLNLPAPGILGNDHDPEQHSLKAKLYFAPTGGGLTLNSDGSLVNEPPAGFVGQDYFRYTVNNGVSESHLGYVYIDVVAPLLTRRDAYGGIHVGDTLTVDAPGVLDNDEDNFDLPLNVRVATGPGHGSLTLNPDGSFVYVASVDFAGEDSFTYIAGNCIAESLLTKVTLSSSVFVPLDPTFEVYGSHIDLWGARIMTVQAYGDTAQPTFGFCDTGSATVTFSAWDQAWLQSNGAGIPIKAPGGAISQGVGGSIVGDVSQPGNIFVDGLHVAVSTDEDGLPVINLHLTK